MFTWQILDNIELLGKFVQSAEACVKSINLLLLWKFFFRSVKTKIVICWMLTIAGVQAGIVRPGIPAVNTAVANAAAANAILMQRMMQSGGIQNPVRGMSPVYQWFFYHLRHCSYSNFSCQYHTIVMKKRNHVQIIRIMNTLLNVECLHKFLIKVSQSNWIFLNYMQLDSPRKLWTLTR